MNLFDFFGMERAKRQEIIAFAEDLDHNTWNISKITLKVISSK